MDVDYEKEFEIEDNENSTATLSSYMIDEKLAGLDYEYDLNALYIPYETDVYLKISRNKDKKCELDYSWTYKKEDNKNTHSYKELRSFTRDKTIIAEDTAQTGKNSLVGKLVATGSQANIEVTTEKVQKFIAETIRNISTSEKLDILKEKEYILSSDVENTLANEINNRIKPRLTAEEKEEALEVENKLREIGYINYFDNILKKVHIGDNKNIMRKTLAEFIVIKGWKSLFMMSDGGAEIGKTYEDELALSFIPRRYIYKVNDMTESYFVRQSANHEKYYDRLICVFGDLGSQKAFQKIEPVFNIIKILITENEYKKGMSDKEEGKYEPNDYKLSVDSIGAVFQTTKFDFLDGEGEQLASRTIKSTPADAEKKDVLRHIFGKISYKHSNTNKKIAEAKAETKKIQSYILYLISKDIEIIIPWFNVFERFVEISNTPYRELEQILYLFKAYCTLTYFECDKIGDAGELVATQKQLEAFMNEISLENALPPTESEFLKMLIGKDTKLKLEIPKAKEEDGVDVEDDTLIKALNPYFNNAIEKTFKGINGGEGREDTSDMTIDTLNKYEKEKAIAILLQMYRLKGQSANSKKENVFFTLADIKRVYSKRKAYKNIDDASKLLNKFYKNGFIDKLDYKDVRGMNIYYLTPKCENITENIVINETDVREAERFLQSEGLKK